jgi:hypothetical protein
VRGFVCFSSSSPSVLLVHNPCLRPAWVNYYQHQQRARDLSRGTDDSIISPTAKERMCARERGREIVGDFTARISQPAPQCAGDKFYSRARRRETSKRAVVWQILSERYYTSRGGASERAG